MQETSQFTKIEDMGIPPNLLEENHIRKILGGSTFWLTFGYNSHTPQNNRDSVYGKLFALNLYGNKYGKPKSNL
jgi:hypothetical protein